MLSLEAGSVVGGKYRLERPLAGGAMGFLWVARHLQLDVEVAIKFMMPQHADSPVARARFEREAKASAQLRTPNVVHVYDYGLEGDTPYLAMELLEGEDLAAYLKRCGRLPPAETLGIISQVCKALRRAHEVGLIHRDLKPANIFLARQGEEIVKILDFGVAKSTGTGLVADATKTGTLIGSPHYMSPEQVRRSKTIDYRSDLWSLGVIIFQCITGQLPFPGEELGDVLVEICTGDIPVPSQLAPDLWPELDQFLERALKREPAERFQSASELARAFASAVQRTPLPEPRGAMDSSVAMAQGGARGADGARAALGSAPGSGGAMAAQGGALAALGSAPGSGGAMAHGSAPGSGGAPAAQGSAPGSGSAMAHGSAPGSDGAPAAQGSAPVFRGGTVALDDAAAAGGTVVAGGTLVAGRMSIPGPGGVHGPGGTLAAGGTLEAVGGALPPQADRRSSARALIAVLAGALTIGAGVAAVVLLRSPVPEAPAMPAAIPSPGAPESAPSPSPVPQDPAPPPSPAAQEPAAPPASALPAASSSAAAGAAAPPAAPSTGAARGAARPARPPAPPPPRRASPAPSNKGPSERDPTFGF
ncbi:serine/threonine-protein kinase [Sorangium sp. So ce1389]|uniref:serine/threonine-protein kinase n=1 Tax=Sorangium sp. So ce1389 TaxID=3133336 RepID=UPI003F63086A